MDIESIAHYFLHCPTYITEKSTLLSTISDIKNNIPDFSEPVLIKTILLDSNSFNRNANANVLNATIEYVLSIKRFQEPLFQWSQEIFKKGYESLNSVSTVIVLIYFYYL